jgi:hypothetical protein
MFGFGKGPRELNLIPKEEQKIRTARIKIVTVIILLSVIAAELFVFFGVFLITQVEQNTNKDLKQTLSQKEAEWEQFSAKANSAKEIKTNLATAESFNSQHPNLGSSVQKIQKVTPDGVRLTSVAVTKSGEASIQATTDQPNVIYQFFSVLQEKSGEFDAVELISVGKSDSGGYNFVVDLKVK